MTGQTAGEHAGDSRTSTSVKAKLVAEPVANFTRIDVDTAHRVVSLTGVVESSEQITRAQQFATKVSGAPGVDNNLQIQRHN